MTAALMPFTNGEFELSVIADGSDFRVLAPALAQSLGFRDAYRMLETIPESEKGYTTARTPGGEQRVTYLTEAGFYRCIGQRQAARISDEGARASVERFQSWVYAEVLPAIRRHGGYLTPDAVEAALTDPDFIIRLATDLKTERAKRALAEQRAAELTPAAAAWDHMASSAGDWSVQQAAGILARDPSITLGRQRLFDFLGASHWAFRTDGHWMAYASAIDAGWLTHRAQHHIHPRTGEVVLDPPQVRVTAKGLARLHKLLGGSEPLVALAEAVAS